MHVISSIAYTVTQHQCWTADTGQVESMQLVPNSNPWQITGLQAAVHSCAGLVKMCPTQLQITEPGVVFCCWSPSRFYRIPSLRPPARVVILCWPLTLTNVSIRGSVSFVVHTLLSQWKRCETPRRAAASEILTSIRLPPTVMSQAVYQKSHFFLFSYLMSALIEALYLHVQDKSITLLPCG